MAALPGPQTHVCGLAPGGTIKLALTTEVVATVEESVLKTEMAGLESQEEDAPKSLLFFKSMS